MYMPTLVGLVPKPVTCVREAASVLVDRERATAAAWRSENFMVRDGTFLAAEKSLETTEEREAFRGTWALLIP
jgi:hypothetical protein